jgi:hypothetical protein
VVAGVDAVAADVVRPPAPDLKRVAVELLKVVPERPQDQRRAADEVAGVPVLLLVPSVDGQAGPVVLQHGAHHGGVPCRFPPLVVVLLAHAVRVPAVPAVRVRVDDPLGNVRLGEEEPVPPSRGELGRDARQVFGEGKTVEQCHPRDRTGVIERETQRDGASSVVSGRPEPVMAQRAHDRDHVAGDRSLGVSRVVLRGSRTAGTAVPPQVGADDGEAAPDKKRCHAVPGRGRPGMAVEQYHRRPLAAVADEDRRFVELNPPGLEALEQDRPLSRRVAAGPGGVALPS